MSGQRAGGWVIAGVVAFVVVDIVLVWFAISSTRSAAADQDAASEVLPTLATPVTAAPTPAREPDVAVEPLTAVLAAADASVAYRAVTGPCPATPAALEVTGDSGVTWTPAAPAEAASIREAFTDGTEVVSIVASQTDGCAPELLRSFARGAEWQVTEELATRWHLADGQVVAPSGASSVPCAAPVQLAQRDPSAAAVLCDDATVAATTDGGTTWTSSGQIDGAASVAPSADGYRVAVTRRDDCAGAQVVPISPALEVGAPGGCLPSDAADGATVLATAGDGTVWIWSGDVVARSSDGGTTW